MNKQGPTFGQIVVMVAFALSCFGLLLFLWTSFGGPVPVRPKAYQVSTEFQSGSQLASYADVRVSGVTVGKVVKIEKRAGSAKVTMQIEPKFAPLPTDTRATLRTKTLLGETFVDLSFGSRRAAAQRKPGSYVQEGGSLPASQVQPTAELDQILDAFDDRTRKDLRGLLTSLAKGLDGRGQDLNAANASFGPALEAADSLFSLLNRQSAEIQSGTRDLGQTFQAVGRQAGAVQELTRSGRAIVDTTSQITGPLRETTRILPTFLDETRKTLVVARAAAKDGRPALAALRPVAPLIRPALQDLAVVAPQLERTLIEIRPVLSQVKTGLPALRRILDTTGPLMDVLDPITQDLLPVAQYLKAYRREIPVVFANSSAATQYQPPDLQGKPRSVLRQTLPINDELLLGNGKPLGTNRSNAYPLPGQLSLHGTGRAPSFTCRNAGNGGGLLTLLLAPTGNQPCVQQGPYSPEGGTKGQYPHIQLIKPTLPGR
ncbi:MlaD family protein [Patulibacter defluvii]|uniref:MlaD family protein n=1 Tax=Patulibacter defluvii TaxID=3095358 RepID=UPI002A75332F|nr:MlaD family protein [Patulibacter sp. DM4]